QPKPQQPPAPVPCWPTGHYLRKGDVLRRSGGDGGVVSENYDAIIIGSGAGGGALAYDLAGYPCLVQAKADADVIAARPLLGRPTSRRPAGAEGPGREPDDWGGPVTGAAVPRTGTRGASRGDIVAVSAGAANSVDMAIPPAGCAHQAGTCRFG